MSKKNSKTTGGYLYVRAYNDYIRGVVGTDIPLTFRERLHILFSKGICVTLFGNDFVKEDINGKRTRI